MRFSTTLARAGIAVVRYLAPWLPSLRGWVRRKAQRHAALALESYLRGNPEGAEASYRSALAWDPQDPNLRAALGQVCYELGEAEKAEAQFRKALDYDYQNLRALQGLGVLLQERGALMEALYLYVRYLDVQPRDANICLNLGVVFHNLGDYESAVEYYIRAEKEAPEDPQAVKNHVLALFAMGRFDEAGDLLKRAMQVSPGDGELDRLLGQVYESHDDFEAALGSYQAALEKDPGDAEAHLLFATAATQLDRHAESVAHAEKAVELFQKEGNTSGAATAYWDLGWDYYKLHDWNRSLQASTESLKLNPDQAPVRFNQGLALLQLGRPDEAREAYLAGLDKLEQECDLKYHGIDDLSDALAEDPALAGGKEILALLQKRYTDVSKNLAESTQQLVSHGRETGDYR